MKINHGMPQWEALQADGAEAGGPNEPPAGEAMASTEEEMETVYIEGVDDIPEPEQGPDPDELARQNQQLQEQLQQLQQQVDPVQSLQQGIAQLGEQLQQPRRAQPQGQQQQPQQQPGESEEEFAKRLKEQFYDDPYNMLNEFQYRKIQPLVAQMMNNNLANSRRFLYVDPGKKDLAGRYSQEIEDEVQGMAYQEKLTDPDVYNKAYERVAARHMDEIIEQRVAEQMASQGQQTPPPTPSSETSTYRPQGGKPKAVKKLTRQEAADAFAKGIPKDAYYDYLVRKGLKS